MLTTPFLSTTPEAARTPQYSVGAEWAANTTGSKSCTSGAQGSNRSTCNPVLSDRMCVRLSRRWMGERRRRGGWRRGFTSIGRKEEEWSAGTSGVLGVCVWRNKCTPMYIGYVRANLNQYINKCNRSEKHAPYIHTRHRKNALHAQDAHNQILLMLILTSELSPS